MLASTTGPATTYTDATAIEGVHDYAVLARSAAAQPGVLSSSFKVLLDKTAPTSGGAPTAQILGSGSVQLAWPAAGDALSGIAGYTVRRAAGSHAPDRDRRRHRRLLADGDQLHRRRVDGRRHLVVRRLRPRRRRQRRPDRHGRATSSSSTTTAPLAPTKLTLIEAEGQEAEHERHLHAALGQAERRRPRARASSCSTSSARRPRRPTASRSTRASGRPSKLKLRAGQTGYAGALRLRPLGNVSPKPARKSSSWPG